MGLLPSNFLFDSQRDLISHESLGDGIECREARGARLERGALAGSLLEGVVLGDDADELDADSIDNVVEVGDPWGIPC